jgi:iron complex outermembrane receptor protein
MALAWLLMPADSKALEQPASPAHAVLEEVIVTARRTEEPLQKTPVAVTALSMEQLEARSAKDLRDIARFTPNVYMSVAGVQNPDTIAMYVRGIGLSDQQVTTDPGVGLYVDGVYYARAQGAVLDFVDLERIEVLRGPQGTLFGKNTAGGAINVISNSPDPESSGQLSLTAGNIGQREVRGYGNAPLGETLALRLSGISKRRDCLDRRKYDDACVGSIDRNSGRAYLRWTPDSNLVVDLIGDAMKSRSHVVPNHAVGYDPNQSFFNTYNGLVAEGKIPGGIPYTETNPGVNPGRYEMSGRAPTETPTDARGGSLNIEYHLDDTVLHAITAYRELTSQSFENGGGGTGAPLDSESVYTYTDSHWFSEELRVDGKTLDDRLGYVLGLYYFGERGETNDALSFFDPLQAGWVNFNKQETESSAAFAHGSYSISDRLRASAGIRYTRETKDWHTKYAQFSSIASASFDPNRQMSAMVKGGGAGMPNELNAGPSSTSPLRRKETWEQITPKVGVDFQWTPEVLVFANIARGSRAGGFNGHASMQESTEPFNPEYTLSYEIGEKAEFLDRHLRINATAFYTDYKDLQQTVLICKRLPNGECEIGEGGLEFAPTVTNAASARIYGGELELVLLGQDGFLFEAMFGYLNAKFTSVDAAATQATGLSTDSVLPFVPKRTLAVAMQYAMDFEYGTLTPRIDYSYRSEVAFNVNPGAYGSQGPVGLINATVTYADTGDRWSIQLYGRNLADKHYDLFLHEFSHVIGGPGGAETAADPREYGLIVTRKF